jgi:putative acyl-CoA dehydrogenase
VVFYAIRRDDESMANNLVELMALTLQASLLIRYAPAPVSDAFAASRLGGDWGHVFGSLPRGTDTKAIIDRNRPRGAES